MTRNERQGPRKPAVKFAHLRKKLEQAKTQGPRKTRGKPPGNAPQHRP